MKPGRKSIHGQWSSRWAFILAATGSAVGLGNIWRFPYITGENGGGAFVLVYIACVIVVGIPIMMSEVLIGRRGRQSPINTMRTLAEEEGHHPAWSLLGWMGVVAGFLILSFYSVVAGWTLYYISKSFFNGFAPMTDQEIGGLFENLLADPGLLLLLHSLFMAITVIVVSLGVKSGLERAVKYLMPGLFLLLLVMVGYAMSTPGFDDGFRYLFNPDFEKLTAGGILAALGQAFFSLSLGMGAIMVYGSYLPQKASIARTSFSIACADTLVAILAGLAIFPLVFSFNLEPGAGPGLIFVSLPIAFGKMAFGHLLGTLFFILLLFAAWTSSISLLEPAVAWLVENRNMKRNVAAILAGVIAWCLGIGSALSFNLWSDYKVFGFNYFDVMDKLTSNVLLPLGGLFVAIFAAWFMRSESSREELALKSAMTYKIWLLLVRFVAPVGVILVFLQAIGLISL
ncbi:MAG: sodium-dependent transporter [Gammaproteobacteria bacterium]|nr:sodium-dependent transporter [Gammaproteobacteria bacterium]